MEKETNGAPEKTIPAIIVGWDEENQSTTVRFDNTKFKNLYFAASVLEMAAAFIKTKADEQRRLQMMHELQQAQQNAVIEEQVRKSLIT